jgi:hypothetical protein
MPLFSLSVTHYGAHPATIGLRNEWHRPCSLFPMLFDKETHIAERWHFICECLERREIAVQLVAVDANLAAADMSPNVPGRGVLWGLYGKFNS